MAIKMRNMQAAEKPTRSSADITEFVELVRESQRKGSALSVEVDRGDASTAVSSFRRAAQVVECGIRVRSVDIEGSNPPASTVTWFATTKRNSGPLSEESKAKRKATRAANKAKKEAEAKAAAEAALKPGKK